MTAAGKDRLPPPLCASQQSPLLTVPALKVGAYSQDAAAIVLTLCNDSNSSRSSSHCERLPPGGSTDSCCRHSTTPHASTACNNTPPPAA
jgi:hypothetical protein